MSTPATPRYRFALAPGLLAAIALFLSPLFLDGVGATIIRYVVAIFALIVAWFAFQAKQWWWIIVFVAIAVIWNPIAPFAFEGGSWVVAQFVAAVLFLIAGASIRTAPAE